MTGRIEHLEKYTAFYNSHGKLHRVDGPAYESSNGVKQWYFDGILHRIGGPAIEYTNGSTLWYNKGFPHREDGPAIEYSDGTKEWYIHGACHREDGPAIEWSDGTKEWYINGVDITKEVNQWREEMGITNIYLTPEETTLFVLYFGNVS